MYFFIAFVILVLVLYLVKSDRSNNTITFHNSDDAYQISFNDDNENMFSWHNPETPNYYNPQIPNF